MLNRYLLPKINLCLVLTLILLSFAVVSFPISLVIQTLVLFNLVVLLPLSLRGAKSFMSSPNGFPPKIVDGSAFFVAEVGDPRLKSCGDDVRMAQNDIPQDPVFILLSLFLLWTGFQGLAAWLRFPFFESIGVWQNYVTFYSMFLAGLGIYLSASECLFSRAGLIRMLHFFVGISSAAALYFLVVLLLAKGPVEQLKDLPLLKHLKPWAGYAIQPNNLVDLFYPAAFYSMAFVVYSLVRRKEDAPRAALSRSLLYLCSAIIPAAAIFLTRSRGGILAFVGGALLFFCFLPLARSASSRLMRSFGVLVFVLLIFLVTLGLRDVIREILTISKTLAQESRFQGARLLTLGAAWQVIEAKGFLGAGLGNFHQAWLFHHRPPFMFFPERSYNDLLWLWAETGIPGLVCWLFILGFFAATSLKVLFRTKSLFILLFVCASLGSVAGFTIHSLMDPTFYVPALFWLFCFTLGIGRAIQRLEISEAQTSAPLSSNGFEKAVTVLMLCLVLGWSVYHARRIAAYRMVLEGRDLVTLSKAVRLDPPQPLYPEYLAAYYENEFGKNRDEKDSAKAIHNLDLAIERDPFELRLYLKRARLLIEAGKEAEVRETFERVRGRLPHFYPAELAMAAFYWDLAASEERPKEIKRYENLGIRHFLAAREIYPNLQEATLRRMASSQATEKFHELAKAGRL